MIPYTPPDGDSIAFVFSESYVSADGDEIDFNFNPVSAHIECSTVAPLCDMESRKDILCNLPILGCDNEGSVAPYVEASLPVLDCMMSKYSDVGVEFPAIEADMLLTHQTLHIDFTLPVLDFEMVKYSDVVVSVGVLDADLVLTHQTLHIDLSLPEPAFYSRATQVNPHIIIELPTFDCSCEGFDSGGRVSAELPVLCVSAERGAEFNIETPLLSFSASGDVYRRGKILGVLPSIGVSFLTGAFIEVDAPRIGLCFAGSTPYTANVSAMLNPYRMVAKAAPGYCGQLIADVPLFDCDAHKAGIVSFEIPGVNCYIEGDIPIMGWMSWDFKQISVHMAGNFAMPTGMGFSVPALTAFLRADGSRINRVSALRPMVHSCFHAISNGVDEVNVTVPQIYVTLGGFMHRQGGDFLGVSFPLFDIAIEGADGSSTEILTHVRGLFR